MARVVIVAEPAGAGIECREGQGGCSERAAAGCKRNPNARVAEGNNVGHAIAVDVGDLAGIAVVAGPPARIGPEVRKLEGGLREMPAAGGERDIDSCDTETDDVGHMVAIHVCEFAGVPVVTAPAA